MTFQEDSFCVLDIETTGFEPENSEIIELFILKVESNLITDEFYSLFKPKEKITNSEIHGITDSVVENSPSFKEKEEEIINFLNNSTLIGHNIDNFDIKFLNYYLTTKLDNKTIDTLSLSRSKLQDKVENHKLKTISEYFNITPPTHSARDDVMSTFEIYKKLISIQ